MLTMVDMNEHSQCHLQVLVRNIEVGVISCSGLALQVITAGNGYQTQAVSQYSRIQCLIKRDNGLFNYDSGCTFSFQQLKTKGTPRKSELNNYNPRKSELNNYNFKFVYIFS